MAVPSGTLTRTGVGNIAREDFTDVVYDISPTQTPMQNNIGRADADQDAHEWPQDSLPAAKSNNQHVDGDDFVGEGGTGQTGSGSAGSQITSGDRVGNYCEIGRFDIVVSRRAEIVRKAGRRSSLGYQLAKAGRALKRDVESSLTANKAAVQGTASVAGQSAGYPAWIRNNSSRGPGSSTAGADPAALVNGFSTAGAATDADALRALSEEDILDVIGEIFIDGGDTDCIQRFPTTKQQFSRYMFSPDNTNSGRIATQYQDQGANPRAGVTAVGAVDVYVSDFGVIDVIPNRFMRSRDVFVLEKEMWALAYLEGYNVTDIGRTGLSEKRILSVDWCVEARESNASGIVADVDASAAMVFASTE